jgi:hypothetical protein
MGRHVALLSTISMILGGCGGEEPQSRGGGESKSGVGAEVGQADDAGPQLRPSTQADAGRAGNESADPDATLPPPTSNTDRDSSSSGCQGPQDCPEGMSCIAGTCEARAGSDDLVNPDEQGPGLNPGYTCALPELICEGSDCGALIQFQPTNDPQDRDTDGIPFDPLLGYSDYAMNLERWDNQFRSWLRRDVVMLIRYAAAKVACLSADWPESYGNGMPIGLMDMSEADGAIPGTSVGRPGHYRSHIDGVDIDLAYYQVGTPDNQGRPVCEHRVDGVPKGHCVAAPHLLDKWRTALFIGTLNEHPRLRIVGVDGKIGPLLDGAIETLCTQGWIAQSACTKRIPLDYEVTNQGRGWFLTHHHHFHVSYRKP